MVDNSIIDIMHGDASGHCRVRREEFGKFSIIDGMAGGLGSKEPCVFGEKGDG